VVFLHKPASLLAYTFSHFCVDYACFFVLFSGFRDASVSMAALTGQPALEILSLGFLLYNTLAFGLQPFIGYLCDSKQNLPIALIGCGLLLTGLVSTSFPWASLVLCALGNACFHVGGGIDSLVHANGRMARSGIFVSSGALGVSLGTLSGQSDSIPLILPILLMLLSAILLLRFARSRDTRRPATHFRNINPALGVPPVLALCLLSVVIRSYVGSVVPMEWRTTTALLLLPSIAAFLGKAAGGYLADGFGAKNVGVFTLAASIPFLCLGYAHPVLCAVGILLFNVTMPITLCAIAARLPQNPGLCFGLTTLGLLCGSAPTFFFILPVSAAPPVMAICIAVSAVCLYISTINQKRSVVP